MRPTSPPPCVPLSRTAAGWCLSTALTEADLDTARAALQSRHHAEPQRALAAFVRFRHLVEVFGARRLKDLMLGNGFALMAPAIAIASTLRLNGNRGFNPQRFLLSLQEALTANVVALDKRPAAATEAERLAA